MSSATEPLAAAKATLTGKRRCNQDRSLILRAGETVVLVLGDGLGGHPRGEIAAQLLVDVCETLFRRVKKPIYDPEYFMLQCIAKAHRTITRFGRRQTPPIAPRTTAVIAIIQDGTAYWTHVGDSRLYLIRDGKIQAQTRDHAQVRFVRPRPNQASRMRTSLTRCLGGLTEPPTTTCGSPIPLQRDDVLLLCSDGLWGQVPSQTLIDAFDAGDDTLDASLQALIERAADTPNSDNVTAVAMRWLAEPSVTAEQATLIEPTSDPRLEQAIQHLHSLLEKNSKPDQ